MSSFKCHIYFSSGLDLWTGLSGPSQGRCIPNIYSMTHRLRNRSDFIYLFVCLFVYLFVCLFVCMFVCLFVCLFILCISSTSLFIYLIFFLKKN